MSDVVSELSGTYGLIHSKKCIIDLQNYFTNILMLDKQRLNAVLCRPTEDAKIWYTPLMPNPCVNKNFVISSREQFYSVDI